MPIYDFKCKDCGKPLSVQLGMNEKRPDTCPCGGELKRIFHSTPVHFGDGFPGEIIKKKDKYFQEYAKKKTGGQRQE